MFYQIARSLDFLIRAFVAESTARQIAGGIAVGVLVGILPKGNLVFVGCLFLMFVLRVNLGAGLLSALLFSGIGHLADPVFHAVGLRILTWDALQPYLSWAQAKPLIPWIGMNNTVVVGATSLGLLQLYPTYRIITPFLRRRLAAMTDGAQTTLLQRALLGS